VTRVTPTGPARIRIGALARQCGLSADTLRHYERLGLLPKPARTTGGFREYPAATLRRINVVQRGLAIGFTLAELSSFFAERETGRAPCRRVRARAGEKLAQLDEAITQLQRLRRGLAKILTDWDARLAGAQSGEPAGLLDALADLPEQGVAPPRKGRPPSRARAA
jgi:DNA-binding transcriptional MerR regulator